MSLRDIFKTKVFISKQSLKIIGIVGGVVLIAIIVALLIGGGDEGTTITLDDGASISIPPGAASSDASISATILVPENGPTVPEGFTIETLYEFSIDEPLVEPVTLQLPLASVTEDSVLWLTKYDETYGTWHGVGFTIEDGYAVVQTDTLSIFGWIKGEWDDFANWTTKTAGSVASWARDEILPRLTLDHWISRFEEITGLDKVLDEDLFTTSSLLEYDDSSSNGLIAASARVLNDGTTEIRIQNKTKMYLQLYFEGPSIEPVRGGYITLTDMLEQLGPTPGMKILIQDSFVTNSVILLPESTADFHVAMWRGDTLEIRAELSDASALFNCLDLFFALVPIADLEVVTAVRDTKGAQSEFYQELLDFESRWFEKVDAGLNLAEETWRAGWKLTTNGLKTIANAALGGAPAYTELADKSLGRVEDLWDKGSDAISGGTLVFLFGDEDPGEGKYRLTVHSSNGGSITTPGEGAFTYDTGTVVSLVATPASGYQFDNWTGDVGSVAAVNAASTTITMNGDYSVSANFEFEEQPEYTFMIAAGHFHTLGLKSDGTVVAVGRYGYGQCDVTDWTDISQIAGGGWHTVGVKTDGTVIAVGTYSYGQSNVDSWTDIVQVAAGEYHTVGLKSDGTVVALGMNDEGECNVDGWTDIVQVAASYNHTVGLKSDGTVVAV